MKICVVKWAWSSNDWQGFDPNSSYYKDDVTKSSYDFVNKEGYAYEWWNFCEREEYYYIHLPTERDRTGLKNVINSDRSNVVFVISKNINTNDMCLIAILEDVECLDSPKATGVDPECTKKEQSFSRSITGNHIKIPIEINYCFRVKKENALIFWGNTKPTIDQEDCFGVKLGKINCTCRVEPNSILKCLESIKKEIRKDGGSKRVKEIKERIDKLIEKIKYHSTNGNKILKETKKYEKLANLVEKIKNLILYGPPGTGKTYLAKRIAAKILGLDPEAGVDRKHSQANDFQKARFGSSTKSSKAKGEWMLI